VYDSCVTLPIQIAAVLLATIGPQQVDFDSDVRPILSDNCFACHGPDEGSREAELRLDTLDGATADLGGYAAVVPGDLAASELWDRVTTTDDLDLMPPPKSHKAALSEIDLATIQAWIESGANWSRHWAFTAPKKSAQEDESIHPIDELVSRQLTSRGLALAPLAKEHTLARRLALDLTGLPPSSAARAALGEAPTESDWTDYIDNLLASPHYGERMAMWWLDGARYADSDGFQQDATRTNWPWRDWVVEAFQNDMPFDEFTTQQLAGDLLPGATPEQILATCFQRNHMHNGEGGRDAEESRVDYVRDRTNTVGMVWLGLTMECAQCHDHKFDPISQRDYYGVSAFFDSIDETGQAGNGAGPFLSYASHRATETLELAVAEQAAATAHLADVESKVQPAFEQWLIERRADVTGGFKSWVGLTPAHLDSAEGSQLVAAEDGSIFCASEGLAQEDYFITASGPELDRITGLQLEVLPTLGDEGHLSFSEDGEFIVTGIKLRVYSEESTSVRDVELVHSAADIVGKGVDAQYGPVAGVLDDDPRTGWTTRGKDAGAGARIVLELGQPLTLASGERLVVELLQRSTVPKAQLQRFRLSVSNQRGTAVRELGPAPLEQLALHVAGTEATAPETEIPQELRDRLFAQYVLDLPAWRRARASLNRFEAQLGRAKNAANAQQVTVLKERGEPRVTSVLLRGEWDKKGALVTPAFLPAVFELEASEAPTRLDLARWITSTDNPLTARVIVNQVWQQLFGHGLVRTPSDFGMQGARPMHRDLLDWLAVDFVEHGWSVKHLIRTIVTSQTYRQDSSCDAELLSRDPENKWLARGARFRMPSWMIRDQALAASGLLERSVGGPPVFPHQPPGVWEDVFNGRFRYEPTHGRARHRRSLYAYWRRNAPPTFLFDTADRRRCNVDVRRTNTPLQSLTLLNDRAYVESAKALARRAMTNHADDPSAQIQLMVHAVLHREASAEELLVMLRVRSGAQSEFGGQVSLAHDLVSGSDLDLPIEAPPTDAHAVELASSIVIANLILNLDEAVTHE